MTAAIRLVFLMVAVGLVGCASKRPEEPFYTRIYSASYDEIWVATLKALNDFPLKLSNKDAGKIQSEVVNGPYNDLLFAHPEGIELPERFRYSLRFNFARFITEEDKPSVRVRIVKDLERFIDFYTGWTAFPSDGIEERVLLYRIEHLLKMDQLIAKQSAEKEER